MSSDLLRKRPAFIAISLIAVFALTVACETEGTDPVVSGQESPATVEQQPVNPTQSPAKTDDDVMERIDTPESAPTEAPSVRDNTGSNSPEVSDTPIPATPALKTDDAQPQTEAPTPPDDSDSNSPDVSDTPVPATAAPTPAPTESIEATKPAIVEPTEPPLINTPSPVANLAPDFTLPSVLGNEYTLSQFRGDKPVAVVFYRAYW